MAQAAKSIPDLVGYDARCYDDIPAMAVYQVDSGERKTLQCTNGGWMDPPSVFNHSDNRDTPGHIRTAT